MIFKKQTKRFKFIRLALTSLIIFTLILGMQITALAANNNLVPEIAFGKIEVTQKDNGVIKGTFEVTNKENYYVGNLFYVTKLYRGKDFSKLELINKVYNPFEINPYETKVINFTHQFFDNIITDNYFLYIEIVNDTELTSGLSIYDLQEVKGSGAFLSLNSGDTSNPGVAIVKNGELYAPLAGLVYSSNESPNAYVTYTNTTSERLEVYPQITVYERNYTFNSSPIATKKGDLITFNPGETKRINLVLPAQAKPESYLASVRMIDQNNKVVSGIVEFRYVVEGISAKILNINAYYDPNTSLVNVNVNAVGPADLTELPNALIHVNVYNAHTRELIVQKAKEINLGPEAKNVDFNIDFKGEKVPDLSVEVSISYNSETLASKTLVIPGITLTEEAVQIPKDSQEVKIPTDVIGTEYEKAVTELVREGIVDGYEDGTFRPERNITRAELTKTIVEILGLEVTKEDMQTSEFTDVSLEHWAVGYINVAKRNHLVEGYGDGTFMPNANITYAEAITLLVRAIGEDKELIGEWPNNYINKAKLVGITTNVTIENYSEQAIRGNIAKLLMNSLPIAKQVRK